jgi:spermidine synthase
VHPEVEKIDCVEMLGAMREASHYFRKYNHDVLDDPRTHLIINDGRNHLQLSRDTHDVIISQPSNPWIVGIGSLFTKEFFDLGRSRLKPGGIFCQWVQTYQMSRRDFGSVLKTFQESFPHVSVWMGNAGDVILLGSAEPLKLDYARLDRDIRSTPDLAEDLRTIYIVDAAGFLQSYIGGPKALAALTAPGSRTITDDNLLLEFSMPRNIHSPTAEMMSFPLLIPARESYATVLSTEGLPPDSAAAVQERLVRYYQGRTLAIGGIELNLGADHAGAVRNLEQAYALAPTDPLIGNYLASSRNEIGIRLLQGGQQRQALLEFSRAAQVGSRPEAALALNNIGLYHYQEGRLDSASHYWQIAADLEPESPIIRFNLGLVYDNSGRDDLAAREYRASLQSDPDNPVALNNLAWILSQSSATAAEAPSFSERAVKLERTASNLDTHGWALFKAGRSVEAETALREAVALPGSNMEAMFHLGEVLAGNGKRDEARATFEKVVQADAGGDLARQARQSLERL